MEQYSQATIKVGEEQSLFELQVDHEVTSHLTQTAKWAKFLSIVGFVGCGLIVIMILILGSRASSLSASPLYYATGTGGFYQIALLLGMVALYFFPCLFLFNFSNKMLRALSNNDQVTLIASFRQLKLVFKYIGILTIVLIAIYLLAILFVMIVAATR